MTYRTSRGRLAVALAGACATLLGAPAANALAAPITVAVRDNFFSPATPTVAFGNAIVFSFQGAFSHTATAGGVDPFNSGVKRTGTYPHTYVAAGSYQFFCSLHFGMTGTARVPTTATPRTGTRSTTFTITFASQTAPSGKVYDVQIKRPGTTAFVAWKTGVTARTATFRADRGVGTYTFQSRMRRPSTGAASAYSPAVTIRVS